MARWPSLRLTSLRLFTLWTGVILLAFLGVSFTLFYTSQKRYFHQRNFRILSAIGDQVQQTVTSHERIFHGLLTDVRYAPAAARTRALDTATPPEGLPPWFTAARAYVPSLRHVDTTRSLPPGGLSSKTKLRFGLEGRDESLALNFSHDTHELRVKFKPLLQAVFDQDRHDEAFDAIVLATVRGEVLFATADGEIRFNRLDSLTDTVSAGKSDAKFLSLAQSTNIVDVLANGTAYKLFIQPCCGELQNMTDRIANESGYVVAGLVATSRLNAESMAISFSLIVLVGGAFLLAVVLLPFLKLVMMGETQRVTATHMLLVATSSVGGVALLTIFLFDGYAYRRLGIETDRQLQELAEQVGGHFSSEVALGFQQIDCLTRDVLKQRDALEKARENQAEPPHPIPSSLETFGCGRDPASSGNAVRSPDGRPRNPYPFYEAFSLVDRNGAQYIKLATDQWAPGFVAVGERPYFQAARDGQVWALPPESRLREALRPSSVEEGFYLESIRSWTNGNVRAVLAARTGSEQLPVAALTIPLRSLIEPVVLAGFAFAVIDSSGSILFHSDSQRNLNEDFFAEADSNRRLRAAVTARQSKALNIRYWGQQHRAYVTPLEQGTPWSLITLYDKQASWALQEEWVVAAMGFLVIYMLVFVALLAAITLGGTRLRHAAWLWPHPSKRHYYVGLSVLYLVLLAVSAFAAETLLGSPLVLSGLIVPPLACALTFFVLRRAKIQAQHEFDRGSIAWFTTAAVLCMLLIAVMPAMAFFRAAHDIHTETYVKHRQLKLAQALANRERIESLTPKRVQEARESALRDVPPPAVAAENVGLYHTFFFETHQPPPAVDQATRVDCHLNQTDAEKHPHVTGSAPDAIPGFLEDWLPYQSEASVEMRELLHDGRSTDLWSWKRGTLGSASTPCLMLTFRAGRGTTIVSAPPRLFPAAAVAGPVLATGEGPPAAGAGRGADLEHSGDAGVWSGPALFWAVIAVLCVVCFLVVRFISKSVFLIGLNPPRSAVDAPPYLNGENVIVLTSEEVPASLSGIGFVIDLAQLSAEASLAAKKKLKSDPWFAKLLEIDHLDSNLIVLSNADTQLYDPSVSKKKVEFIEQLALQDNRTVVLVSRTSPRLIADGVPELRQRWNALFASFIVDNRRPISFAAAAATDGPWTGWMSRLLACVAVAARQIRERPFGRWNDASRAARQLTAEAIADRRRYRLHAILRYEAADGYLARLCADLAKKVDAPDATMSAEEVLEQLGERAAGYYRSRWMTCTQEEKLVLAHLAKDGLVNAKSRGIVRRLLLKGLVRSCPEFRLMNTSFERFVLSGARQADVARCESISGASTWDRFQWPFAAAMVGGLLFFVVTQKEVFDSTLASIGILASTIPAVVRAIGLSRATETTAGAVASMSAGGDKPGNA